MKCSSCGTDNPARARFCGGCGHPLATACPSCGADVPRDFKFCGRCGRSLAAEPPAARENATHGERRQLTVLFCDMVGSTALSERLDPEDLRKIVLDVQKVCAVAVESHDGHIAQYLGDGLLIYFGYPTAHEDDAVRAVRAALQILDGIAELNEHRQRSGAEPVLVRMGLHTGGVVAGEVGAGARREKLAMGQTPNIAARVQSLAEPNTILVSQSTYALTQGFFNFEPLGPHLLRGISEPVAVHQVLEVSGIHGRFELVVHQGLKPLVGRRTEMDRLLDEMRRSRSGEGRAVLVSGEAGIGKSRLIYSFRARVKSEVASWWVYRGTPYTRNTSFYPVIELIHVQLRLEADDSPRVQLAKIEESCEAFGLPLDDYVPLIARLLEVPLRGGYPVQDDSPTVFKEKVLEFFVEFILARTRHQPVVFLMEDLHWIDPSTLEFLDRLLDRSPDARLLVLFTTRPEFECPWAHDNLTRLDLRRLDPDEGRELVRELAEPQRISSALMGHILEKSDGVPLYLEELTKSLLESDDVTVTDDGELVLDTDGARIPATLRDSLAARLDRLGPAKEVAQIGSALGREFSYDLLLAASGLVEAVLRDRLERLIAAELLFGRADGPTEVYSFKHALVQDAAHLSLVKARRQAIHERIARLLEGDFADAPEAEPERLALHWEEAAHPEDAVRCFVQAAQQAVERSAYAECVSHCHRALGQLARTSAGPERLERELEIRALLGVSLVATRGYAAGEVEANYSRCREICGRLGDTPQLVPALYGLWVYHLLRGHREDTLELAEAIHGQVAGDDPVHRVIELSARGITAFYQGRFDQACRLQGETTEIYRPDLQERFAQTFGEESGLLARFYRPWCRWIAGEPESALRDARDALKAAERLESPYVLATALLFEMIVRHAVRDIDRMAATAERFARLSEEQRFPFFLSLAHMGRGWVRFRQGDPEGGLAELRQGLDQHLAIGTRLPRPYWMTYEIDLLLTAGHYREGLEVAARALELSNVQLDTFYDAEIHRQRGELLARLGHVDEAETALQHSLELGRRTGAHSFELRAATGLARLLQSSPDRRDETRDLLRAALDGMPEAFETRDLANARALLDEPGS